MDNVCSVEGCFEYAANFLCRPHLSRAKQGAIRLDPAWGVVLNPPCSVAGCLARSFSRKTFFCHVHQQTVKSGRELTSVRPKRRRGEPFGSCTVVGCDKVQVCKGLCKYHYGASRYSPKPGRTLCAAVGCSRKNEAVMCSVHAAQFKLHGFTWVGERPAQRIADAREAKKSLCSVTWCEELSSSVSAVFCSRHGADSKTKGCSAGFYVSLMDVLECQICGSGGRLVVDHDHSCHPGNLARMCERCIRGRICNNCNSAIGFLGESVDRAVRLGGYMEKFVGRK